ncbi:hypothetical protein JCM1393_27050 [Clostridium carnis]
MKNKIFIKVREELCKISEIDDISCLNEYIYLIEFINNIEYLRNANEDEIIISFTKILDLNSELSLKALFYIRDKVNGLGERRVFRILLHYLAINYTNLIKNNLHLIPIYGRWDDLYSFFETPLENYTITIIKKQLNLDIKSNNPSYLAKWLKSENTSSMKSRLLGRKTRVLLGYSPKEYRKTLSLLRKRIGVIERVLSEKKYSEINYKNLTINNLIYYRKTLIKNDSYNYINFINNLSTKNIIKFFNTDYINSPNKVIKYILNNTDENFNELFNVAWEGICNSLKSKLLDINETILIFDINIEDIINKNKSFEIFITALMLFNNLNKNNLKDYFIYSKGVSKFSKIKGNTIIDKIQNVNINNAFADINLKSALDLLLFTAIKKNFSNNELPENILLITSKDFNSFSISEKEIEDISDKWTSFGYKFPYLNIWSLNHKYLNVDIEKKDNITCISGFDDKMWEYILSNTNRNINKDEILIYKLLNDLYKDVKIN